MGGLRLGVPPDQEGTQAGGPGSRPGVLSPHHQSAGALGWRVDGGAGEPLLPGPGVLALLRDPVSDDFMALLRTNFHLGRGK